MFLFRSDWTLSASGGACGRLSRHILLRLGAAQVVALLSGQHGFAHAHGSGSDLHQLIVADKADGLLQGKGFDGRKDDIIIFSGGAHIGQLFFFAGIHVDVLAPVVLADDHPFINRITVTKKSRPRGSRLNKA